jgi:hypothetical protein
LNAFSTSIALPVACAFVLGFALAWGIRAPASLDAPTGAGTPAAPLHGTAGLPPPLAPAVGDGQATAPRSSLGELWAKGKRAKDGDQDRMEWQEAMVARAQADPAALRSLIQRYESERDPGDRELLKSVLGNVHAPEVMTLAARLAASGNPAQRQDAFDILKQVSSGAPEVRQMLRQAIATEQAPAVLSRAIAALTPSIVAAGEAEAIVAQLNTLAQHADPAVRSQSVLQLGQWDKSMAVEGRLQQAMADQAPEVRQAAVTALGETGIRSDSMKLALLEIIRKPDESAGVKDGALHALQRYPLSKDELALYQQARSDTDKRFSQ